MSDDGLVMVLDFVRGNEWDAYFKQRKHFGVDLRKTTSSRTPGKVNAGIVKHVGGPRIVKCESCGGLRFDLGGIHAGIEVGNGLVRDCIGKLWQKSNSQHEPREGGR